MALANSYLTRDTAHGRSLRLRPLQPPHTTERGDSSLIDPSQNVPCAGSGDFAVAVGIDP